MKHLYKPQIVKSEELLIGALLRGPAQAIHRRIIHELNASGFEDLRLPHIAVLQFPGPDGERPTVLAERAGMSKQAMNQLLGSLEELKYLKRADAKDERRSRTVKLTKRGRAAFGKISGILLKVEEEWSAELGAAEFVELKKILVRIWDGPLVR